MQVMCGYYRHLNIAVQPHKRRSTSKVFVLIQLTGIITQLFGFGLIRFGFQEPKSEAPKSEARRNVKHEGNKHRNC